MNSIIMFGITLRYDCILLKIKNHCTVYIIQKHTVTAGTYLRTFNYSIVKVRRFIKTKLKLQLLGSNVK